MYPVEVAVLLPKGMKPEELQNFSDIITSSLKSRAIEDRIHIRFLERGKDEESLQSTEVIVCGSFSPELFKKCKSLKWIAFWSAGLDNKIFPELIHNKILVTSANGVHGPNIADHVLMWMLMFTRRMDLYLPAQHRSEWLRTVDGEEPSELAGQTLGIVGYGNIGEALCERAKACGMRVVATKRDPASLRGDIQPDKILSQDRLTELLGESHHVCIAVPHTPETHHLINEDRLGEMRKGAYLYNIGRGKVVAEDALIAALQSGHIAGAGLDVFEIEPLPSESLLWKMPNVFITPHSSGATPHYFERFAHILLDNFDRYLNGKTLKNQFDSIRGY